MDQLESLRNPSLRVVGANQVVKALEADRVQQVFLGKDADGMIYYRVNGLCEEKRVPVTQIETMQELGKLCAISVKAAAAALLK